MTSPPPSAAVPGSPSQVTVVGIGADGWAGLTPAGRTALERAAVVVGSPRQLGLLPDLAGQHREPWGSPLDVGLLERFAGRDVAVVASGDPMLSGVGSTVVGRFGHERVTVVPHVSSVALAHARLGWDALATTVLTVVGRRPETVLRHLAPGARLVVLSSDEHTPGLVARLLEDAGYGASTLTVLGDLGGPDETLRVWEPGAGVPRLHVLAIECRGGPSWGWATGLPDEAFEHDGQLTKRDLRASALSRLAPRPHELLWDVGAGAGSIGIEWMRAHPTCHTWAFEKDRERGLRIRRNAARLGVPGLHVAPGEAPAAFARAPLPNAVFVGGGATEPGLLEACRAALLDGGRLVVHGVTLETERLLLAAHSEAGGELVRLSVESAEPLGSFTGWRPARAVTQWTWTKSGPSTFRRATPDWTMP